MSEIEKCPNLVRWGGVNIFQNCPKIKNVPKIGGGGGNPNWDIVQNFPFSWVLKGTTGNVSKMSQRSEGGGATLIGTLSQIFSIFYFDASPNWGFSCQIPNTTSTQLNLNLPKFAFPRKWPNPTITTVATNHPPTRTNLIFAPFRSENVWFEKNFSKQNFVFKNFLVKKNIWSKSYRFQKNFGSKNFGSKKLLGPKRFWVQKSFGSKKIFGPKKIWVQKNFWSKKIFGPKLNF